MPSVSLWAYSAEKLFIISRLSRSAERSKRSFTKGVVEENGICSAAFCESAVLRLASSPSPSRLRRATSPKGRGLGKEMKFAGRNAPPGGAVAQRLRGFKSAEPEKTVKRSSRRTGVNLQFFPVQPSALGLKGASSPFFVAPARRNRWHFSGSLLVSKENIPRQQLLPQRSAFPIVMYDTPSICPSMRTGS